MKITKQISKLDCFIFVGSRGLEIKKTRINVSISISFKNTLNLRNGIYKLIGLTTNRQF